MNNKGARIILLACLALISVVILLQLVGDSTGGLAIATAQPEEITISQLEGSIRNDEVAKVEWQGEMITGEFRDGTKFTLRAFGSETPAGTALMDTMREHGVTYEFMDPPFSQTIMPWIGILAIPVVIFLLIYLFLIRPAQTGGNQAINFGRSRAKRAGEMNPKVSFDDVGGIDEAKEELAEVVDYLKNTKKYVALGAKIPKGILLTGPPGVGKTHMARAIAGEAGVPFFHISGSDFVEMFVGVGAARVRDLFETAKAHRPCLIFVDEIDAVGRQRGAGMGGGHDEREQTLNQLLVEMDGFDPNTGVIVLAATNRPDVLDPALLRPGRFDRQVVVDLPDAKGREKILEIHSKGKPFDEAVALETVAKRTPGFTGADLANALNESALLTARRNRSKIGMVDIEEALDRVMAGPQRKSRVIDPKEREVIAYHEAGHALVGELLDNCDPVHKVTILPRGMSLGSTWSLPEKDSYLVSMQQILDNIAMTLGGRGAEEIVFSKTFTGAADDLKRVTRMARAMVTEYGMSEKVGMLAIGNKHRNPFLGRDYASDDRDYSEDVAKAVDEEVRRIVDECYVRTKNLITEKREQLDAIAQALLERETLDRKDFLALMNGEPLPPMPDEEPAHEESGQTEAEPTSKKKKKAGDGRLEPDPA